MQRSYMQHEDIATKKKNEEVLKILKQEDKKCLLSIIIKD